MALLPKYEEAAKPTNADYDAASFYLELTGMPTEARASQALAEEASLRRALELASADVEVKDAEIARLKCLLAKAAYLFETEPNDCLQIAHSGGFNCQNYRRVNEWEKAVRDWQAALAQVDGED